MQAGVLNIVFKVADEHGLLLLDMKDLRAMLQFVGDNRAEFTTQYGNVSAASIGAIQRALLAFEDQGGDVFFGEPALDIRDWMRTDADGRGYINILSGLSRAPKVYGTFLLWMLTELFERLPEVGDLEKPRMIFFFDEAHLLFSDAPKALVQKIVQVVKLIRSKGVGVYFVTQSPSDIPDDVLAQLSNRVQHALRALHSGRAEVRPRRRPRVPREPRVRHRADAHGAWRRRGAGQLSGRRRRPLRRRAREDPPAAEPYGACRQRENAAAHPRGRV